MTKILNYNKLTNIILISLATVSLLTSCLMVQTKFGANANSVQKLDDKSCLIHCNDGVLFSPTNLLVTKKDSENGFNYKFFDNNSKKELYSLTSSQNINFDEATYSKNGKLCALAWAVADAIFNGANLVNKLVEVFGSVAAGPLAEAIVPLVGDIAACVAGENIFVAIPMIIGALNTGQIAVLLGGGVTLA